MVDVIILQYILIIFFVDIVNGQRTAGKAFSRKIKILLKSQNNLLPISLSLLPGKHNENGSSLLRMF